MQTISCLHLFLAVIHFFCVATEADLITAPDYVVIKAADEFTDKTTAINEMWQTDFTYFKLSAGVGIISAQSWTITAATSSRGSSAPTCGLVM